MVLYCYRPHYYRRQVFLAARSSSHLEFDKGLIQTAVRIASRVLPSRGERGQGMKPGIENLGLGNGGMDGAEAVAEGGGVAEELAEEGGVAEEAGVVGDNYYNEVDEGPNLDDNMVVDDARAGDTDAEGSLDTVTDEVVVNDVGGVNVHEDVDVDVVEVDHTPLLAFGSVGPRGVDDSKAVQGVVERIAKLMAPHSCRHSSCRRRTFSHAEGVAEHEIPHCRAKKRHEGPYTPTEGQTATQRAGCSHIPVALAPIARSTDCWVLPRAWSQLARIQQRTQETMMP